MATSAVRHLLCATFAVSRGVKLNASLLFVSSSSGISVGGKYKLPDKLGAFYDHRRKYVVLVAKSSQEKDGIVAADDDGNGVSLGTMKLPLDTDLERFETLLFQVYYATLFSSLFPTFHYPSQR
uniref:Uncharacterized protein MANES_08G027600 n=1 Tax=Rhizophora mucronata TaxID=61149 RepID=A0A2P2IPT9_RHIMU